MKKKLAEFEELSTFYKALAHPARLAIIQKFSVSETYKCSDFVRHLPFAQATISEHLRKLAHAKLISVSKKGSSSEYRLNKEQFEKMKDQSSLHDFSTSPSKL